MEHYQAALLRYATRVLNNEDAAQDVVQEAFIRLNSNMEKIKIRGVQVKGWLFRTTHNAAVDYIRKESRRRNLHERQSKQADIFANDPERQQVHDEKQALVMQHLNTLKPKEREVLVLRKMEGYASKEVAERLGKSDDAVRPILSAKRCERQAKCSGCFPAFPEKVAFYILLYKPQDFADDDVVQNFYPKYLTRLY